MILERSYELSQQILQLVHASFTSNHWMHKQARSALFWACFRLGPLIALLEQQFGEALLDVSFQSGHGVLGGYKLGAQFGRNNPVVIWFGSPCKCCGCGSNCDPNHLLESNHTQLDALGYSLWKRYMIRRVTQLSILVLLGVVGALYYYRFYVN